MVDTVSTPQRYDRHPAETMPWTFIESPASLAAGPAFPKALRLGRGVRKGEQGRYRRKSNALACIKAVLMPATPRRLTYPQRIGIGM